MCTPPLGPVGASPDDSQAASGRVHLRLRPCGYPCPVSGLRAIRARALCVLLARGRGCGRACRRRGRRLGPRPRARRARPTPFSSTCPARSRAARSTLAGGLVSVPRPRRDPLLHRRLGAQRRARLRAQRALGRHPAGRCRDGRRDRLAHLRRRAQGAGHRLVRRLRHRSRRRRRGRLGGSPAGSSPIPGIGWGAVDERRVVRSDGAYRGSEVALHIHLSSDWHDLPAGTEVLLGYSDAAASGHAGSGHGRREGCGSPATAGRGCPRRRLRDESRTARRTRRPGPRERRDAHGFGRRGHAHRHRGAPARAASR